MLGRLLHLGSGGPAAASTQAQQKGPSKDMSSLDSVQEDIHTRNLLFPDAQALYQHRNDQVFPLSAAPATPSAASSNAFDYSEDVDLDVRDVRVLIMQDTLGPTHTSLLFDSHPAPVSFSPTSSERSAGPEPRRTPLSSRKGSLSQPSRPLTIQAESPPLRQGAFDRRGSIHGRSQSQAETGAQKATREYKEELATFSSCIFGNSELMAYKGTSTKVHVVPSETRSFDHAASNFGDGRSSMGRSSARSSKLSQSYSSQTVSPSNVASGMYAPRHSDRKKVLITRLFPVSLSDDSDPSITPQSRCSDDYNGFPFPSTGEEPGSRKKKPQPKQRRTPMYAVVLVVQLPSSRPSYTQPKSAFRESGSYNDQDFFSSSYSSTRLSGWTMAGSGTLGDTTDSSYSIDGEDRIDCLTQHWDIIMRTLTHLQSVVATSLHTLLKQVDVVSPIPLSTPSTVGHGRTPSLFERRSGEVPRVKASKSTIKLVSLWPNCLSEDAKIAREVNFARTRIVKGLGASRVITGQGRWGIWRDEATWASKWATSLDEGQFFYNLLTGFLATHTDWLQALCPSSYRRSIFLNRRSRNEEDLSLPARTIVVSDDKMAARRLVFLLSAFLAANQQMPGSRTHRPSTSASLGGFSHSPPTFVVPILREESLRRKINRRSGLRRASHSRTASQSTSNRASAVPAQLAHLSMERSHERRVSDAASIRTANMPMPGNDFISRKSSAATTTTIMPETTTPHFSSIHKVDSRRRPRPGSSGSVAADDLKRSLKRGESSGQMSSTSTESRSQGLKWGSLVSGLWSSQRRGSTDRGSFSQTSDLRSPVSSSFSRPDKLSEMVREVSSAAEEGSVSDTPGSPKTAYARDVGTPRDSIRQGRESFTQPDRTPDPNGAFESPVKTSINALDGVIDVDVPFPDYIQSFESAISSPSSSGYLSTPGFASGLESFEQSARLMIDGDLPLNAAGWLDAYHPDFAIQAIPPQDGLLEQVKASLRAEPTPAPANPSGSADLSERWVDVGSVIIADVTTQTTTRLVYRRLVKPKMVLDKQTNPSSGPSTFHGGSLLTPSIPPYETQLEEEWIQEVIITPDELIAEAVKKVTSRDAGITRDPSPASSQAHSEIRVSTDSGRTVPETASETTQLAASPGIPRVQCRTVVLSALEETIRAVIDNRENAGLSRVTGFSAQHGQNLLRDSVRDWITNLDTAE